MKLSATDGYAWAIMIFTVIGVSCSMHDILPSMWKFLKKSLSNCWNALFNINQGLK